VKEPPSCANYKVNLSAAVRGGTAGPADTVLRNFYVYTLDRANPVARAVAVAAGRVVYAGSVAGVEDFIRSGQPSRPELKGAAVPGIHRRDRPADRRDAPVRADTWLEVFGWDQVVMKKRRPSTPRSARDLEADSRQVGRRPLRARQLPRPANRGCHCFRAQSQRGKDGLGRRWRANRRSVRQRDLSLRSSIAMHTRNSACQLGQEALSGRIREGLQADLLVLDRTILEVPLRKV
jgi:hypothetical protein